MIRIFLIGYMGAGKTTLGKALARKYGVQFIDLDWYIEERFHKTVSELFSENGEQGFRQIEKRMLHEVAAFEDVIISAGGGTPCFFDNMEYMNSRGQTVFLYASPEVLFQRLRISSQSRPILCGKTDDELLKTIEEGLARREGFYRQAKYVFFAENLENRWQIDESVEALAKLLE